MVKVLEPSRREIPREGTTVITIGNREKDVNREAAAADKNKSRLKGGPHFINNFCELAWVKLE
jgi:hypothetical protein